jgi:hypothetical protein
MPWQLPLKTGMMPLQAAAPPRPLAAKSHVLLLLLLLAAAARASEQSQATLTAVEPAVYATLVSGARTDGQTGHPAAALSLNEAARCNHILTHKPFKNAYDCLRRRRSRVSARLLERLPSRLPAHAHAKPKDALKQA